METKFEITAVYGDKCYQHFGIHPASASLYGDDPEDIQLLVMEISKDQTIPKPNGEHKEADYWVWYEYDSFIGEEGFSSMLYPQRFLLDMCFPAGIKGTEEAGQGKAYRVEIIEIKKYQKK